MIKACACKTFEPPFRWHLPYSASVDLIGPVAVIGRSLQIWCGLNDLGSPFEGSELGELAEQEDPGHRVFS